MSKLQFTYYITIPYSESERCLSLMPCHWIRVFSFELIQLQILELLTGSRKIDIFFNDFSFLALISLCDWEIKTDIFSKLWQNNLTKVLLLVIRYCTCTCIVKFGKCHTWKKLRYRTIFAFFKVIEKDNLLILPVIY